ncbi:hypothetical protein Musp01_22300 [Muricauda sp. NBRC 101325]|nr:hypothetical protein Musp01_22300 [Muricauda sp. NBRC 101325]
MTPSPQVSDLTNISLTLTREPSFKKQSLPASSYWVELYTDKGKYEINGIDYKYIRHKNFKRLVKKGTKINVGSKGEYIYMLEQNNIQFLRFEEARYHKSMNRTFARIVFGTGFVALFISFLFKREIKYNNDGTEKVLDFGPIIIIALTISIIIGLVIIGGSNFISGKEFIY